MDERDLTRIKAVLLDMDGTLVDSDAAVERAWTIWAAEHEADLAEVLVVSHGAPADSTVRHMFPAYSPDEVDVSADRQLALQYDDLRDVVPAVGAHELLETLAALALPWAVVTSADTRLAALRLAAAGIEPPVLVTVDQISAGKPDPEGYRVAAERLGIDPRDCLVVEDAAVGVTAGRAAGAMVAGLRGIPADLAISDLGQLAGLLRAASGSR
ncbi:sugar phosphatase [Acidothermaceae bacterium B102]|nr:sugar phosphatase [Acidothermaceae bacterium B102]